MREQYQSYGIHWFRRDLRLAGNPGLKYNWQKMSGCTLGLFCFDQKFLSRPDFSFNRFQFFLESLKSLKHELQMSGGDLLVLNQPPEEAFKYLIQEFQNLNISKPTLVTWNRDYEPYARQRDQSVITYLANQSVEHQNFRDHLLIEPHELVKNGTESEGYQVFSPFARKWCDQLSNHEDIKNRISEKNLGFDYVEKLRANKIDPIFKINWQELFSLKHFTKNLKSDNQTKDLLSDKQNRTPKDHLDDFIKENLKSVTIEIPKSGTLAAFDKLNEFKNKIKDYGKNRDFPDLPGTSKLSMFLKNGTLTTAQIIAGLKLKPYSPKAILGAEKFLSEIIWREFYYHILFRKPEVEHQAFNPKFKDLKWQNNMSWFKAWKEGMTGFPIVDAGMRELKTTGWMHNRVRMIVASFLTKDLLIDWKWGEKYFMETLLDGDLAPNNGGWQWAASTGCDPQPYFRIFNPWSQSEKFDPEAKYIKTYIPELRDCDPKSIHKESALRPTSYPRPIVDHSKQRLLALNLYSAQKN